MKPLVNKPKNPINMKNLFLLSTLFLLLLSCKSSKHAGCDAYSENVVVDSTENYSIYEQQEALATYIESLSEKEKKEWINGTFTEEEKNNFIKNLEKN